MVVLAIAVTLIVCLLIDWVLQRRDHKAAEPAPGAPQGWQLRLGTPVRAGGFLLQEEMAYHPGHTWALVEGPGRVRVGIDDFAAHLVGQVTGLQLPAVGEQLQQGARAWVLSRGGRRAPMLAPVTGQVIAVNARLQADPGLAQRDPYGDGWLALVRPDTLRAHLNNLLSGRLVHRWLEEAAPRLRSRVHGMPVLSLADGGNVVPDVGALLTDPEWAPAVREFFLTDPEPEAR